MSSYTSDGPVVWPLLPNWKRGVDETLEFLTSSSRRTLTGYAQKKRLRIAPRRSFLFETHPLRGGRRLLDNLRTAQGAREWLLPVWMDRQRLSAPLASGATAIPCATSGYDFAAGRYAVLRAQGVFTTQFEVVEIGTVEPDEITLASATGQDWPAGTLLYPVRLARTKAGTNDISLLTDDVATMQTEFEVSEPCDWTPWDFADEYRGEPVWDLRHNWSSSRTLGMARDVTVVDNSTSTPVYYDFPDKTFASINTSMFARTRAQVQQIRSVLYALAGRFASVWVSSGGTDLVPVGTAESTLTAEYAGYEDFALGREGRQDLRIELVDGTVYYRRVTDASASGGNEVLTLDAALPSPVAAGNIRRVSFLVRSQQAADATVLRHSTDTVCQAALAFESAPEPPEDA